VAGFALEQVLKIVEPKAPSLQHLQLVVQPFHEAATLALTEVVGDQVELDIKQC
jgi:hypothetical protein